MKYKYTILGETIGKSASKRVNCFTVDIFENARNSRATLTGLTSSRDLIKYVWYFRTYLLFLLDKNEACQRRVDRAMQLIRAFARPPHLTRRIQNIARDDYLDGVAIARHLGIM